MDIKAQSFTHMSTRHSGYAVDVNSIPQDSLRVISQITNSDSLSLGEKNTLVRSVSIVDRYAHENQNLRSLMLNEIARHTLYLEQHGSPRMQAADMSTTHALRRYNDTQVNLQGSLSADALRNIISNEFSKLTGERTYAQTAVSIPAAAVVFEDTSDSTVLSLPGAGNSETTSLTQLSVSSPTGAVFDLPGSMVGETAALIANNPEIASLAVPEIHIPGSMIYETAGLDQPAISRISLGI